LSQVQLAPLIIFTMLIAIGHTKVYLFLIYILKKYILYRYKHTFSSRTNKKCGSTIS